MLTGMQFAQHFLCSFAQLHLRRSTPTELRNVYPFSFGVDIVMLEMLLLNVSFVMQTHTNSCRRGRGYAGTVKIWIVKVEVGHMFAPTLSHKAFGKSQTGKLQQQAGWWVACLHVFPSAYTERKGGGCPSNIHIHIFSQCACVGVRSANGKLYCLSRERGTWSELLARLAL